MQHRVRLVTFNITPSPDDLRTSGLDQAPVQQAISGRVQGYLLSGVWRQDGAISGEEIARDGSAFIRSDPVIVWRVFATSSHQVDSALGERAYRPHQQELWAAFGLLALRTPHFRDLV
jgi:hypothetical protein